MRLHFAVDDRGRVTILSFAGFVSLHAAAARIFIAG